MADINKFFPKVIKWEGGYVNDPADSGGRTKYGVTQKTWIAFGGKKDIKDITEQDAMNVMKSLFWDKCKGDLIENQSLAEIVVDWFWGSGYSGLKAMQRALNLVPDGKVGPATLHALNSDPQIAHFKIKQARIKFIDSICESRPLNLKFKKGWLNRINSYNYEENYTN
jgi:lysozyme family protein